jgi:hypothetical protein
MRKLLASRPSPAMAVAFVALLAALSGTAIALPGTNSVDSGDIRNNTIRSKDIRNNNVRSGDIRNGTVTGTDVRDNSLTGADINESTLGKVPSAAQADTATSATSATSATNATTANSAAEAAPLKHWFVQLNEGQSTNVFSIGGIVLQASCADDAGFTELDYTLSGPSGFAAAGDDNFASDGSAVLLEDPGASDAAGGDPDIQLWGSDAAFIAVAGGTGLAGSAASWADADTGTCKAWGHVITG